MSEEVASWTALTTEEARAIAKEVYRRVSMKYVAPRAQPCPARRCDRQPSATHDVRRC